MNSATAQLPTCSTPVDRLAAIGLAYKEAVPRTFTECPTLYPGNFRDLQRRLGVFWEDITGFQTVNGMTAIGLVSLDFPKFGQSIWAVRCACGNYELRKYQGIRAKCRGAHPDWCERCFTKWVNAKHAAKKVGAGDTATEGHNK